MVRIQIMKTSIKSTAPWSYLLILAVSVFIFYHSCSASDGNFTVKNGESAQWFEEKDLQTDFESVVDILQNHSHWKFRSQAIKLLGAKYPKRSADIFLKVAEEDSDLLMRDRACLALVKLKDKRVIGPLKKLMTEVDSLNHKIDLAFFLSTFGDLSGFKYFMEAKDSSIDSDRYLSSLRMVSLLDFRKRIIEEYKVDILEVYLQFGKDPYAPVRRNFALYWPAANRVPKDIQRKFTELAKLLAEKDPDEKVKLYAQPRAQGR